MASEKNLGAIYGFDVRELMLPEEVYKGKESPAVAPDLIVGLELEIEGWASRAAALQGWHYTEDGSLRNNGREAITVPTKTKYVRRLLEEFYRHHEVTEANNYTERCSTHVHMNVQDYSYAELRTLCMVYQICERLLFGYVGHERDDNVFCVPWYESGNTSRLVDKLVKNATSTIGGWVKYSALNLLPVQEKGTVEFRHLHGTCNVDVIMGWVNLISRMHLFAKKVSPKDLTALVLAMNTVSNYDMFLGDVFGSDTHLLTQQPDYKEQLSVGVIDAKLMLLKPAKKAVVHENADTTVEGLIRMLGDHADAVNPATRERGFPFPNVRIRNPEDLATDPDPIIRDLQLRWHRRAAQIRELRPTITQDGREDWTRAREAQRMWTRDQTSLQQQINQRRDELRAQQAVQVTLNGDTVGQPLNRDF